MSDRSSPVKPSEEEDGATTDEWVPKEFNVDPERGSFILDGEVFVPMSGEVHYFMMQPDTWADTLTKVKEAKLNCVTTAVEWALHEPFPGMYDFENELDLGAFIELAFNKRLQVILKIGPQVSMDRDLGGLPHWLLTVNPKMKLRAQDESFMFFFGRWLQKLYGVVQPCLIGNGGPIIMIQIEDAYGSYPLNDRNYLYWLRDVNKTYVGNKAVLFTSDYNDKYAVERGYIHGVFATLKFGASSGNTVKDQFEVLTALQPNGPFMNSQYWVGYPTYWMDPAFNQLKTEVFLNDIADFVREGIGFNLHMFKGGTHFDFTTGSREDGKYCMTSYDCDAPISEAGDCRKKWALIRALITLITDEEFSEKNDEEQQEAINESLKDIQEPEPEAKGEYGIVPMTAVESFMNMFQSTCCGKSCVSIFPKSMEEMCVRSGFLAYTTTLKKEASKGSILKGTLRDRAYVILDMTEPIGTMVSNKGLELPKALPKGSKITFLVENLGRTAYAPGKLINKGMFSMYLNAEYMDNWIISTYSVRGPKSIEKLQNVLRKTLRNKNKKGKVAPARSSWFGAPTNPGEFPSPNKPFTTEISPPAFFYGTFTNAKDDDSNNKTNKNLSHEPDLETDIHYDNLGERFRGSYLNLTGWKKGIVYFNEFCLGRYWGVGPQQTLFVPGGFIRPYPWKNRITILELKGAPKEPKVNFAPQHMYAYLPEVEVKEEDSAAVRDLPYSNKTVPEDETEGEGKYQNEPGQGAALSVSENLERKAIENGDDNHKDPEQATAAVFSRDAPAGEQEPEAAPPEARVQMREE